MKDKQRSATSFSLFNQKLGRIAAASDAARASVTLGDYLIAPSQGDCRRVVEETNGITVPRHSEVATTNKRCKRDDFLLNLGGCRP